MTTARVIVACALLPLAAACSTFPSEARPASEEEEALIAEAWALFAASRDGEPLECPILDDVRVYESDDPQADCFALVPVYGCATPRADGLLVIIDPTYEHAGRLAMHEALHQIHGCWVAAAPTEDEWQRRYSFGRKINPSTGRLCDPVSAEDRGHCDSDVWTTIQRGVK